MRRGQVLRECGKRAPLYHYSSKSALFLLQPFSTSVVISDGGMVTRSRLQQDLDCRLDRLSQLPGAVHLLVDAIFSCLHLPRLHQRC